MGPFFPFCFLITKQGNCLAKAHCCQSGKRKYLKLTLQMTFYWVPSIVLGYCAGVRKETVLHTQDCSIV